MWSDTEGDLRERFGLGYGGEIRLDSGDALTPAARNLVRDRKIRAEKRLPHVLSAMLGDLRSWLGQILRAEVTGETLGDLGMGELDFARIHKLSHKPLPSLGHDHRLPDVRYGQNVALLNWLRAQVREVELAAVALASPDCAETARPDIVRALNRLSSALYVLMLLTRLAEQGKPWCLAEAH